MARALARHGAQGLTSEQWSPLVEQAMLVFLLLAGYAGMGFWLDRQNHPVSAQGLPRRQGWPGEAGLGLAVGWSLAVVCAIPMVVVGGIAIVLVLQPSAWGWLLADAAFFALAALAEEVAFRGYGFQRFAHAVGPVGAALGFAAFYAIVQNLLPGSSHASFAVSLMLSLVLSTAYLRTKALWLSWGLNFGWKASRERRQQPFARGAGRSHGAILAHRRRLWAGRQLGCVRRPSRGIPGDFQGNARSGLPL
jgi:membrane protease YdiL (CAAX protease family)